MASDGRAERRRRHDGLGGGSTPPHAPKLRRADIPCNNFMTNIEKAVAFYAKDDIDASGRDGKVYVHVSNCMIEVSESEVDYRAELYDELYGEQV